VHEAPPPPAPVAPLAAPAPTPDPAPPPAPPADCRPGSGSASATPGNPAARRAAQRGLGFLAREAVAWQQQYACYGCHVQAVTVEAFSVGVSHQYAVPRAAFTTVLHGMLDLQGGAHGPMGLYHGTPDIGRTAKVLGAAAFARYDELVGGKVRRELLREARLVLARQRKDGSVTLPWTSPPIITGTIQGTAQAIVTWKAAYERTADVEWLTAVQKAESFLQASVERWHAKAPDLQSLDYTILGLSAAGVGSKEAVLVGLADQLRSRQRDDGGWALARGEASSSFATGQALYALRRLGLTDRDAAIERGTRWLISKQDRATGGWSDEGYDKAEAMWAVLGLVAIDVVTIDVAGVHDGQHLDGEPTLAIEAHDNQGGDVVALSVDLDDQTVASACGGKLAWTWPRAAFGQGRRVLEIRATNARGEVSHRRVEVFTGDTFMTQVGSRFEDGATELSLRDLSAPGQPHTVRVEVFAAGADGHADATRRVWTSQVAGAQGALRFAWNGRAEGGAAQPAGKYVARLSYRDAAGTLRQTEELPFVHASAAEQRRDYGQIGGTLHMAGGRAAENAEVQLVDEAGNVVGSTRSTSAGQYRFRNVDAGKKYEIRVKKDGFAAAPAAVAPARAAETEADIEVRAK
jgi:squalene-hopene/tetraprenyl-beta-curcumene cyclase